MTVPRAYTEALALIDDMTRTTTVAGQTGTLFELAWERIERDDDDGLKGTDYSRDVVSGSRGSGYRERRENRDRQLIEEAAKQLYRHALAIHQRVQARAPHEADAVASRKALLENRVHEARCENHASIGEFADSEATTDCCTYGTEGEAIAWKLANKMTLCSWCIANTRKLHRLPNKDEMLRFKSGMPPRWPAHELAAADKARRLASTGTRHDSGAVTVESVSWKEAATP